jgi:hypothetical protein
MAAAEGFHRLCRITDYKTRTRVRQIKSGKVDLAFDATEDSDGFTKVYLSMPRRMLQRHEHLLSPPMPASHIILHNRDAPCEAVFVPKPLEDPLRGSRCFFGRDLSSTTKPSITKMNGSSFGLVAPLATHAQNRRDPVDHFAHVDATFTSNPANSLNQKPGDSGIPDRFRPASSRSSPHSSAVKSLGYLCWLRS